jgi:hypothetical protein
MRKYTTVLRNNPSLNQLKEINSKILVLSVKEKEELVQNENWMEILLELLHKKDGNLSTQDRKCKNKSNGNSKCSGVSVKP